MNIKDLRVMTGLSQSKFANKFGIPVRTIQKWEIGQCSPPPYVPEMILKILQFESVTKGGEVVEKRLDIERHRIVDKSCDIKSNNEKDRDGFS